MAAHNTLNFQVNFYRVPSRRTLSRYAYSRLTGSLFRTLLAAPKSCRRNESNRAGFTKGSARPAARRHAGTTDHSGSRPARWRSCWPSATDPTTSETLDRRSSASGRYRRICPMLTFRYRRRIPQRHRKVLRQPEQFRPSSTWARLGSRCCHGAPLNLCQSRNDRGQRQYFATTAPPPNLKSRPSVMTE